MAARYALPAMFNIPEAVAISGSVLASKSRSCCSVVCAAARTSLRSALVSGVFGLTSTAMVIAFGKLALFRSSGRLFIPPALRERNVRLREFVSYWEDSMFHCGAIAL